MSETTKLGHPSIPDALNSRNDQDSSDFWGVTFWSAIWVSSWTFALFGCLHFFWYCSARSIDATMCYYTLCASEIMEIANPPEESQFSTQRTAKHSFDWSERTQGHTYYSVPVWFMSSIPFNQLTATKSFSDGLVRPREHFHSLGSNEIVRARADPWRDWQILNEIVCVFPNTHTQSFHAVIFVGGFSNDVSLGWFRQNVLNVPTKRCCNCNLGGEFLKAFLFGLSLLCIWIDCQVHMRVQIYSNR